MFRSTKHYGHEVGLTACFRQHRADTHCRLLHGYALAFTFVFEAKYLDHRNWVIDFGALDELKNELKMAFDHKLLVARDDPAFEALCELDKKGLARIVALDRVGCEAFAKFAWDIADLTLKNLGQDQRVRVLTCEVREHGANSAIYVHEEQTGDQR